MLPEAPAQVRWAVFLLWASLGLSIVATVVDWEPIETTDPQFQYLEPFIWATDIAFVLLAAALNYFVSRRRNWARKVQLALTAVSVVAMLVLPGEMGSDSVGSIALTLAITAMDLAALYWLFTGEGAKWFSSRTAA